jgi:hypothetical protein
VDWLKVVDRGWGRPDYNYAIFGNYIGVQEPEKILKVLKFDILRVPPTVQIPTKKVVVEFCSANFTVEQITVFGNYIGV